MLKYVTTTYKNTVPRLNVVCVNMKSHLYNLHDFWAQKPRWNPDLVSLYITSKS